MHLNALKVKRPKPVHWDSSLGLLLKHYFAADLLSWYTRLSKGHYDEERTHQRMKPNAEGNRSGGEIGEREKHGGLSELSGTIWFCASALQGSSPGCFQYKSQQLATLAEASLS